MHRRRPPAVLVLALLAAGCQADGDATHQSAGVDPVRTRLDLTISFDTTEAGDLPTGLAVRSGTWAVVDVEGDAGATRALAQTGQDAKKPFNLVVLEDVKADDVELSVRLRAVAGAEDQGGGLAWRVRDEHNYYVARWNPLERNFRVYKVLDGERRQLGSSSVGLGEGWHVLKVSMRKDTIRATIDGRAGITVRDPSLIEAGRIGLWTKADAETWFDDLHVSSAK